MKQIPQDRVPDDSMADRVVTWIFDNAKADDPGCRLLGAAALDEQCLAPA